MGVLLPKHDGTLIKYHLIIIITIIIITCSIKYHLLDQISPANYCSAAAPGNRKRDVLYAIQQIPRRFLPPPSRVSVLRSASESAMWSAEGRSASVFDVEAQLGTRLLKTVARYPKEKKAVRGKSHQPEVSRSLFKQVPRRKN